MALCVVLSLALIIKPSYRRHSYLPTAPSIIPPVSVYLDAENQLSEASIRPFTEFLIKHLDGRRADLLYFLDASRMAKGDKYKTLYRFGFRPVDVPHGPTGQGAVKEAVDRKLAMHAYERAVLGPAEQEFIIITGDAGFVPLIYRLVALGHRVQIWASPVREAYRVVETYLGVNVIDLGEVVAELTVAPVQSGPTTESRQEKRQKRRSISSSVRLPVPSSLSSPGEEKLYFAIMETLAAHAKSQRHSRADQERNHLFHSILGGELGPRLSGVGYATGSRIEYWIDHMIALGVLETAQGHVFPKVGTKTAEDAARRMFANAQMAAGAAMEVASAHDDGAVTMSEVAASLASKSAGVDTSLPLLRLVASGNAKRATHARYFVRSASKLGLLVFDTVPDTSDVIKRPRLPTLTFAPDVEMRHEQETQADGTVAASTSPAGDVPHVLADSVMPEATEGRETAEWREAAAAGDVAEAIQTIQ